MPVQGYELLVGEIACKYKINIDKVKLVNDMVYLSASVILALFLNHSFCGIGIGTIIITFVNAPLIAAFGKVLDKFFIFDSFFTNKISD